MVVGIVSPGAMGSAIGAAYAAAGARVVATVAERSPRTRHLAESAGLELLPDLDAVVAAAELVLSVVPPGESLATAAAIAASARRMHAAPFVADLNAVAPATVRSIQATLAAAGLELVDGSISGGPPNESYRTRVYLSGPRAEELAGGAPPWLDARVVGGELGVASAVKMCTASVYKGFTALLLHALVTAEAHGVLAEVLDDLDDSFPAQLERAARLVAVSATKAERYVGEMREIASTQESVGLTRALFDAMALAYGEIADMPGAAGAPEEIAASPDLRETLARLSPGADGNRRRTADERDPE